MLESDEESIRCLKKAYYIDLPTQIDNAKDEVEKNELVSQRHKISHLLEHGYGVSLSVHLREDYRYSFRQKHSSQICPPPDNEAISTSPNRTTHELQASAERKASERFVPFGNPDPKEAPRHLVIRERKRVDRSEDVAAVAKLRNEFTDITRRLTSGSSPDETQSLTTRRDNIRMLLERGYRVLLNKDE